MVSVDVKHHVYLLGSSKPLIIMQKLAKNSASVVVCLVVCFGETKKDHPVHMLFFFFFHTMTALSL